MSDTQAARIAALDQAIRTAFDGVPRPQPAEIAPHACEECRQLAADLAPHPWETLPASLIETHHADLALLSAAAFAYYLPAYMLYALRHLEAGNDVLAFTVYQLAPEDDSTPDSNREQLRCLTADQVATIEVYVQLLLENEDMRLYHGDFGPGLARFMSFWRERWQ